MPHFYFSLAVYQSPAMFCMEGLSVQAMNSISEYFMDYKLLRKEKKNTGTSYFRDYPKQQTYSCSITNYT